jgi:hypothetical protein
MLNPSPSGTPEHKVFSEDGGKVGNDDENVVEQIRTESSRGSSGRRRLTATRTARAERSVLGSWDTSRSS